MTGPVQRVGGVVLAAGRSTRMGRPKALLPAGDRPFVAACVAALGEGGCDPVLAVVGRAAGEEAAAAARGAGAIVVWNRAEDAEQLDSLRLALDCLDTLEPEADGALVLPVDHPLVAPATVQVLLVAAAGDPAVVVRPVHDGRPGHPTLFRRSIWARLAEAELAEGARSVIEAPETEVRDVVVEDDGVATDIDTPEEYRRTFGRTP